MNNDVKHLISFIESICDDDMMEEHNLVLPIARLKRNDAVIESMGDCVNCDAIVDRNSGYEETTEGYICSSCVGDYDEAELAEKDIILKDYTT